MHLDLTSTFSVGLTILTILGGVFTFYAFVAFFVFLTKPGRGRIIAPLVFVVALAASLMGIFGNINMSDNGGRQNRQSLQSQARQVYNLKLSDNQVDALLSGAQSNNSDRQEYGKTLIAKGNGQVQKVQLVHINGTWLIIDAGTRNELPHD